LFARFDGVVAAGVLQKDAGCRSFRLRQIEHAVITEQKGPGGLFRAVLRVVSRSLPMFQKMTGEDFPQTSSPKKSMRTQCPYSCFAGVPITILAYFQSGNKVWVGESAKERSLRPSSSGTSATSGRRPRRTARKETSRPFLLRYYSVFNFVAGGRDRHPRRPFCRTPAATTHRNVRTNGHEHAKPASVRGKSDKSVVLTQQRRWSACLHSASSTHRKNITQHNFTN